MSQVRWPCPLQKAMVRSLLPQIPGNSVSEPDPSQSVTPQSRPRQRALHEEYLFIQPTNYVTLTTNFAKISLLHQPKIAQTRK